ncbi:MAG: TonB-dependent receptor, partial [Acidobacteriia bacterium]|nr:TonB-dependent receptor [Terriglobia bacterium]
ITDPSGSQVPNAVIDVTSLETGFQRKTVSNERGEYEAPLLPVGTYKIDVNVPGFAKYEQTGITVRLDNTSEVNITLQIGQQEQVVTVSADASILTTQTFDVGGTMNALSLANMPITSRNSFNLALFGAGYNGTPDNEFGNPTFAFGGMQRKAFIIDGVDNSQRGGPGRLGIFSPEDIQEVKVLTNDMDAEYGRTVGGIISMVTKGGTNDFHGEGLVLERRPGLIARPPLAPPPKPFQQWATFSANVGGPIKKDKLFYFASAEYEPEDGANPITITHQNALALGLPPSELTTAPFKQRFQSYLGRVDYQLNPTNNFYLRYSEFQTPSKYNTSGGLLELTASNNFNDFDQTASAQWTSIITPNVVNELRFGYLQRVFHRPPESGEIGPVIVISGVAQLGSNSSAAQGYNEDQFNFIDNVSYQWGRHQIKIGTDIDTIEVDSRDRLLLQYTFSSLTQYLNTINGVPGFNYAQLQEQFGNNFAEHRTTPVNLFGEDRFYVTPSLTLSYGLRWEYRIYPTLNNDAPLAISRNLPSDAHNFAPRAGFAWQLTPKTVVRGGYGIFYDTLNLRLISLVDRSNGAQVLTYVINGNVPGAPQFPNAFSGPVASYAVKPSVYGFSPTFKTQYAQQANLQVEQELARNVSVTLGVQWYGGHREPVLIDTNLGAPVNYLADGRPQFSSSNRPNANFNQILALSSIANSVYYGGFVNVAKRFSRNFQLVGSYTLGWAFNENDSVGDSGSNVINPTNLHADWAFSSSDQRHRFVMQGVWQPRIGASGFGQTLVNGWTLAPNMMFTSGFPFTAVAGSDLNGDGVNNDYPLFGSRNQFRGPGFKEINLRVSRVFPVYRERVSLEIIGEAENLLNTTNAACTAAGCSGAINTAYGPSMLLPPTNVNFRQITAALNSRQIQLGARLRF